MGYTKQIVCLANSRKPGGRCIAGKEWNTSSKLWIRPVSDSESHSLSSDDRRYEGGKEPALLDVINVPLLRHYPLQHQCENHLIDNRFYWSCVGRVNWSDVSRIQDKPASLWSNVSSSSGYSFNRVSQSTQVGDSLFLISVDTLDVIVGPKSEYNQKRVVKGRFPWRGTCHMLQVTDPDIEVSYLSRPEGSYEIRRPLLCISLGDPFEGFYYKLIAAVIEAN